MGFSSFYINKTVNEKRIKVHDTDELIYTVNSEIDRLGWDCSLNHIDVSEITNFDKVFYESKFNGDISQWDVSHGVSFYKMFYLSKFNSNILSWDMSSAERLDYMFYGSEFNKDINAWNIKNAITMDYMFSTSEFNQDLDLWDVSNVCSMQHMFEYGKFEKIKSVSEWNVKSCNVYHMFSELIDIDDSLPEWYNKKKKLVKDIISYMKSVEYEANKYHKFTVEKLKMLDPKIYTVYIDLETGKLSGSSNALFYDKIIPVFSFEIRENMKEQDYTWLCLEINKMEYTELECSYRSRFFDFYPFDFVKNMPSWKTQKSPYKDSIGDINLILLKTFNYYARMADLPEICKDENNVLKYIAK